MVFVLLGEFKPIPIKKSLPHFTNANGKLTKPYLRNILIM